MKQFGLIITAAGNSSRFEHHTSKQFFLLDKKPVILKTINCFSHLNCVSELIITMRASDISALSKLMAKENLSFPYKIIEGGETRKISVENAFKALRPVDKVMIHDGARPFLSATLLDRIIKASEIHEAVIPGIPEVDTVKLVRNQMVEKTLNRDHVYRIQTPQCFSYRSLKEAYAKIDDELVTDEALLMETLNKPIYVIQGDEKNRKITTINDI